MPITINNQNFDQSVLAADKPVILDFWASWCGPCRELDPLIKQMADELREKAVVGKVNVDDNPELLERLDIMGVPTVLMFQKGKEVDRTLGFVPKVILDKKLSAFL
ncbi:MAG: thioredoxin [Bacteroidota bacterium]